MQKCQYLSLFSNKIAISIHMCIEKVISVFGLHIYFLPTYADSVITSKTENKNVANTNQLNDGQIHVTHRKYHLYLCCIYFFLRCFFISFIFFLYLIYWESFIIFTFNLFFINIICCQSNVALGSFMGRSFWSIWKT